MPLNKETKPKLQEYVFAYNFVSSNMSLFFAVSLLHFCVNMSIRLL